MIVKSDYRFAINSIPSKKAERFNNTVKAYNNFKYKFSGSKYLEEAKKYEMQSHYLAAVSAFDWADISPIYDREKNFRIFFKEAKFQLPYLADKKQIDEVNRLTERAYFLIVKNSFAISEEKKSKDRLPYLEQTVKTYYNFVDQFPKSRYSKEAEKFFNNSNDIIKKIKTNG